MNSAKPLHGLSISDIAAGLSISEKELVVEVNRVTRGYKTVKRKRGDKVRNLTVPIPRTKKFQRLLYRNLLRALITGPAADPSAALSPGRGVRWAARRHAGSPVLYRVDIKDFYPSVTPTRVRGAFRTLGATSAVAGLLTKLVTVAGNLPQGAPTSSAVGELVLRKLDRRLRRLAEKSGCVYTRYADDIIFSGGKDLEKRIRDEIEFIVTAEGWEINPAKRHIAMARDQQLALGLCLNKRPNVTRSYYETLRRTLRFCANKQIGLSETAFKRFAGQISYIEQFDSHRAEVLRHLLDRCVAA